MKRIKNKGLTILRDFMIKGKSGNYYSPKFYQVIGQYICFKHYQDTKTKELPSKILINGFEMVDFLER